MQCYQCKTSMRSESHPLYICTYFLLEKLQGAIHSNVRNESRDYLPMKGNHIKSLKMTEVQCKATQTLRKRSDYLCIAQYENQVPWCFSGFRGFPEESTPLLQKGTIVGTERSSFYWGSSSHLASSSISSFHWVIMESIKKCPHLEQHIYENPPEWSEMS